METAKRDFEDNARLLIKAYKTMSAKDFEKAFKFNDCGSKHLWLQYSTTYNHNMISFMGYLNIKELQQLLNYIWNNLR